MTTILTLILAAATLAILAVAMSFVLGWANKAFHVDVNPRVESIADALPGANCGGCGYVGCGEYAEAVAAGDAKVDLCAPGGASCAQRLGEIMGVEVEASFPYRPVIHCAANHDMRLQRREYHGELTCVAANLVAGVQGCVYGCLGFGDCRSACAYDAIHVINGLSTIDYGRCVGCGACARVCPRNIISMVPFKSDRMLVVACSNKDVGVDVKAVCKVGCIGCKSCTRKSDLFIMEEGNIPSIDYDQYGSADFSEALEKCPMSSLVFVGKPSEEEMEAVRDETLPPGHIEADFRTTVDDTTWRG